MAERPDAEFDESYMARLEAAKGHWWVRGMQDVGAAILGGAGDELTVLDAGCGVGTNLGWLADLSGSSRLHAADVAAAAVARVRESKEHDVGPGVDVLQASVAALPYADQSFDLIISMDVLQHLTAEDAAAALNEMHRVLREGGRLLVRTNAAFGRSRVQQRLDWRLYTPDVLRRSLREAGFGVDLITPVNLVQGVWASLPRPWLRGARHDGDGHDGDGHHGDGHASHGHSYGLGIPRPTSTMRNAVLLRLVRAEARWFRASRRPLPFGHSLYGLAHRPGPPT